MDTEKSGLEDQMLKAFLLKTLSKKMDKNGHDVDEFMEKADKEIRDTLMRLYVVSKYLYLFT